MIDIRRQRLKYIISDYLMLNIGWLIFTLLRYDALPHEFTHHYTLTSHLTSQPVVMGQIFLPFMMLGIYWLSGYYNNVFFKSRIDELLNTMLVSMLGTILVFFGLMIDDQIPERLRNYEMIALLWLWWFTPVYIARLIITTLCARRIQRREIVFDTLVIGTTQGAVNIARRLSQSERGNGFNIVGYVELNPSRAVAPRLDLPVYQLSELEEICDSRGIERFVVAMHPGGMRETGQLISSLFAYGRSIFVTLDMHSLILSRPRILDVAGEPLIDITRSNTTAATINCKRVADIVLASLAVLVLCPVYLVLAAVIKYTGRGPVIYRQERIGLHKRKFKILKFRTMYVDAESDGPTLASVDDPRVTPVGRFLRKYRLDELPQFFNVLRGDMSLVGPRPEREFYISQIVKRAPYYSLLHQVRPGITSWGMVKFGYAVSVDEMIERLRYDLMYIENVSVLVDLKILFYTVHTVITGKGL